MTKKSRINWVVVIIIVVPLFALGLILGKNFSTIFSTLKDPSEPPVLSISATPEPLPVIIPKALLSIDDDKYELNGAKATEDISVSYTEKPRVSIGKDSKLQLSFSDPPQSYNITLLKEDEVVFRDETLAILQENIPSDGEYRAICQVKWNSDYYKGLVNYSFTLSVERPSLPEISATEVLPGELIVLTIKYADPDDSIGIETNLDFKPNIFFHDNQHVILLPVSYYHKNNEIYEFKLIIGDEVFPYEIKVMEKEFVVQQLTIDTKIAAETRNDKSAQEVKEKIDPLRPVCDDMAYWEGDFIMPVEGGRVRDYDFGKRRHVNGSPTSYRHNGLDIGHDLGVPVMASNSGRILIADYLIGTGNTVIIEHGFGLKTWYYHMDELKVSTGDMVTKGDLLGTVGSTGFSTGPHLHFSSSINWVYINPLTLINEGLPLLDEN